MQRKILLSFTLLWAMLTIGLGSAFAQTERTVTGVVKDDTGETLPSATVVIKGTTKGTVTDFDGNYSLVVPSSETILVYSFTGMEGKEVKVGNQTVIDVVLGSTLLNQVVVTSFGIEEQKRTLGYALQTVDSKELTNSRETNLVNALAGKVAGVQVTSSGGQAGASSRITIRGQNSLVGNSQPLFVVDGIPIDNRQTNASSSLNDSDGSLLFTGAGSNRVVDIDPSIIETTSVLKGAAATAIWGARGANGVILITTKKGKKGKPKFNFSSNLILNDAIVRGYQDKYLQGSGGLFQNGLPDGKGGFNGKGPGNGQQTGISWGPSIEDAKANDSIAKYLGELKVYDPRADFFRLGQTYDNVLSVSGGFNNYVYRVSYSNRQEQGIAPGNDLGRNNLSVNFGSQSDKKFNFQTSINYFNTTTTRLAEGNGSAAYMYTLSRWPISNDITNFENADGTQIAYTQENVNNPIWLAKNNNFSSSVNRLFVNATVSYKIKPWITVYNRLGVDGYQDRQKQKTNLGTFGRSEGRMFDAKAENVLIDNTIYAVIQKQLNDDFEFSSTLGHNINSRSFEMNVLRGIGLKERDNYNYEDTQVKLDILPSIEKVRSTSVFATAKMGYQEKIYVEVTGRNDWFSTLEPKNRSVFYPSISSNTILSELIPALPKDIVSYWGVRVSYAQAGSAAEPYVTRQLFTRSSPSDGTRGSISVFDGQEIVGFQRSSRAAEPNLTHQLKKEFEVGTDIKLFKGTLRADFAYYNSRTVNQIVPAEVSGTTGFSSRWINGGVIQNKGVEMTVTADVFKLIQKKLPLEWTISVNYTRNRFELISLQEGIESLFLGGFSSPQIRVDRKYGYGVIWGSRLERNDKGEVIIDSSNGRPKQANSLGPIGNTMPDWLGSIRNTFTYKGLSLTVFFDGRFGGDILNMDLYYTTSAGTALITENRNNVVVWQGVKEDGTTNDIPVIANQTYYQNWFATIDELFVEDASFIKLREISLSYTLPKKLMEKWPIETLSFTATGRNLYISSNFSYFDPEGNLYGSGNAQGFYHAVTPGTRSYAFGLNVTF
jgi:TonB-linked SusC/RagA family outer membrane protein